MLSANVAITPHIISNNNACPSFMTKVPPEFTVVIPLADSFMLGCFPTLRLPR